MPVYEYKGLDGAGKATSGIVDADNAKAARSRLRRQGVFPTEMHVQEKGKATRGKGLKTEIDFGKYFQFISPRDIATMTTQLATLVGAAIPMVEALTAMVDQVEKQNLKVIISQVKEKVNEGSTLADAMAEHPRAFDNLYVQMVRAGERSGALDEVLNRLATYTDKQVKLQGQVLSALMYPMLMSLVGLGILVGLFTGVVPRVRSLFDGFGDDVTLPFLTRVVFAFGDLLIGWFWVPLIFGPLIGYGVWRYIKTPAGRLRFDKLKLRFPIMGRVHRLVAVSRFCRTLATLLVSGVPIVTALQIGRNIIGNQVLADAVDNASKNIQEGQSVAVPLRQSGEFPPVVTHMISIGEKTGDLERMLTVVADAYDNQVEAQLNAMTSLLGPVVILMMGGMVFVVALGMLMPMMNLSSMVM